MGRVYLAQHTRLPRRAAVKVLLPGLAHDHEMFERFKREAEVASSLGNRHIVNVFDLGIFPDGSPYMVMEYLEGQDLIGLLTQRGCRLGPAEASTLLAQAVQGLAAAHDKQIIHRDIKPANMFLARDPEGGEVLKILDFGLSKICGVTSPLTGKNVIGTPAFMSPEQLINSSQVDQRTDVWALGVTLFQLLTGDLPFDAPVISELCRKVVYDPAPPIRSRRPSLAPEIELVMSRVLEKDIDKRYPSVRAFWAEAGPALEICAARIPPDEQPFVARPAEKSTVDGRPRRKAEAEAAPAPAPARAPTPPTPQIAPALPPPAHPDSITVPSQRMQGNRLESATVLEGSLATAISRPREPAPASPASPPYVVQRLSPRLSLTLGIGAALAVLLAAIALLGGSHGPAPVQPPVATAPAPAPTPAPAPAPAEAPPPVAAKVEPAVHVEPAEKAEPAPADEKHKGKKKKQGGDTDVLVGADNL